MWLHFGLRNSSDNLNVPLLTTSISAKIVLMPVKCLSFQLQVNCLLLLLQHLLYYLRNSLSPLLLEKKNSLRSIEIMAFGLFHLYITYIFSLYLWRLTHHITSQPFHSSRYICGWCDSIVHELSTFFTFQIQHNTFDFSIYAK